MPHLGFKSESGPSKFLRRDLGCPFGRPANDGGDATAIFEQTPLVLRLEAHISETCEMQHRPEAIGSIREIVARDGSGQSRIETAENHVQTPSEDIRFITDQTSLLVDFHIVKRVCPSPVGYAPSSALDHTRIQAGTDRAEGFVENPVLN
jgi:hypothetical protein